MKKNYYFWALPFIGTVLVHPGISRAETDYDYRSSTNRLTLNLQFGFNIHARFKGVGTGLLPTLASGGGRVTLDGDPYNYSDGYVGNGSTLRADSTGNFLGYSSYWGYDNAAQYNPGANTVTFHNLPLSGAATETQDDGRDIPGLELAYDWQWGEKPEWNHLRYGWESAFHFLRFSSGAQHAYGLYTTSDVYAFGGISGQQPLPGHQGSWAGNPGDPVLGVPGQPGPSQLTHQLLVDQNLDANIWGIRLGPYLEYPITRKISLQISGGLAAAVVDARVDWQETLVQLSNLAAVSAQGGGHGAQVLWGYYGTANITYQMNQRWNLAVGAQLQDIGVYSHNFNGRIAELDLSKAVFFQAGIGYSF